MTISHLFQDFGTAISGAEPLTLISESEQEEQSVANYERGYTAGWEDSLQLQLKERSDLSKTLKHNLEDLEFTFAEARQQVLASMAPILEQVVSQVLPEIIDQTSAARIVSELQGLVAAQSDLPIQVSVPPDRTERVRPIVEHALGPEVAVFEDPTLTEDQVALRVGRSETVLDPSAALEEIRAVLSGLTFETEREVQHGQA
ncbi:MAG: hypothetical protein AB3N23_02435 [Paracoccaceae bacterium]